MACHHLDELARFQVHLIQEEAESEGRKPEEIAISWIELNSEEVRNVFCGLLCPFKEDCQEQNGSLQAEQGKENAC